MAKDINKIMDKIRLNLAKKYSLKKVPSNTELVNYLSEKPNKFISKPSRTISGVAPVAIMTKPIKCPHAKKGVGPCLMCPGGPDSYFGNIPQSYTGKEPATMRGLRNNFDPYLQVFNRLEQYFLLNHNPEKVELIIMGGTFPSFNKKYQEEFVKYSFKALNDFSKTFYKKDKFDFVKFRDFFELHRKKDNESIQKLIKNKILKLKGECDLVQEQKKNEKSKIRCIGLTVETRPDYASLEIGNFLLSLGCTRVELGIQSLDDEILKKINRGHTLQDSVNAIKILRDLGFKLNFHVMIGLPGSDKEKDISMFKELFSNDRFKPDMLKIYPCMVLKGTKLYELYKKKKYNALTLEEAAEIISESKKFIPEYCRIMRIQRDIPTYISEAGPEKTNLREYVYELCNKKKIKCKCIRCREIKDEEIKNEKINVIEYDASEGKEFFISLNSNDKIIGFCRLRFPSESLRKEITKDSALIRELHVYGPLTKIGEKGNIQHRGFGKKLILEAEKIAKKNNKKKIVIISGIGVREYYKKFGYRKEWVYMVKMI